MKIQGLTLVGLFMVSSAACNLPSKNTSSVDSSTGTTPTTTAQARISFSPSPPSEHRIGIRTMSGATEFYDRATGEKFYPRGAALWRWKYWPPGNAQFNVIDTIFNTKYGQLDSALAEMPEMRTDGFNTVRLWFNACWGGAPGCLDQPAGGINRDFLLNMARFLQVAKENGIYAILTMDSLPDGRDYQRPLDPYRGKFEGYNLEFMTQGGIEAQSNYQTDLIRGLMEVGAPMDAILAFQLKEEAYFEEDLPPFTATAGSVTPANGKTYNLADPGQRRALMEDSWVYYIAQVNQAIKAVDPTALVGMGFFYQQEPNPVRVSEPRIVYMDKVLNESDLDFVSLSAYPGYDLTMKQMAENFDLIGYNKKPIMIGEFGGQRAHYPDVNQAAAALQAWQVASCEFGIDGWQVWTWDGGGEIHEQYFWEAVEGGGAIRRALSPGRYPDPCTPGKEILDNPNLAYGKPVKASGVYDLLVSEDRVVDLSRQTRWNAGGFPPQWIEVDLGQPTTIGLIRLVNSQDPEGETVNRVLGKGESGNFQLLYEFRGVTRDNDLLEYRPPQPLVGIRYIRIETITSPSWIGWKEIEVYAP